MGAYVNPTNETKESFLSREGKIVNHINWSELPKGELPVILIDNGLFTAAGICYCENELKAFFGPNDFRQKEIYIVPVEKLMSVSNLKDYYNT